MGDSDSNKKGNRDIIASICYQAFSSPWPSKVRDGMRGKESGIDGARAARVLAGVLQVAWSKGSLSVVTGLEPLGYAVGLVGHYAVRDALNDLQELGWLKFRIGTQDDWRAEGKSGQPSVIELLPKSGEEGLNPHSLPLLTLDMFRHEELGHPGWWAVTRIWFETRDDFQPNPVVGVADVVRLTGMTRGRVKRLLPKMAAKFGQKVGNKYSLGMIREACTRDTYTDYRQDKHRERLKMNRSQRQSDRPVVPQLWRFGLEGRLEKLEPLGYFKSGRAYWTEEARQRGDIAPVRKELHMGRFVKSHESVVNLTPNDEIQYLPSPVPYVSDEDLLEQITALESNPGTAPHPTEIEDEQSGYTEEEMSRLVARVPGYRPPYA
jgi:hypothetical protein